MEISFDSAKSERNGHDRGLPFSLAEFPKERINIRLSHEVIEHFKSAGEGWQTRIDKALRQFIAEHPNAH